MKRLLCLLVVWCLLAAGLTGCGDDGTGKGFRFPLEGEPRQLDPQVSTDRASITLVSVLFEGLTRLDEQGKPQPGAADWTVSEDGLTYTFTLKESYWSTVSVRGQELLWENPVAVTADDFVFGMQRALDPHTGSELGKELYAIQNAQAVHTGQKKASQLGVKATDYRTVTITLTQPDERFLATLATTPCMPCNREFFSYTAGRYGLEKEYVLTNGAFCLTAWNHDQSLLLSKNEYYHDADRVAPSAVRFVIDPEDAADGLLDGTMDAAPLAADQVADMTAQGVQSVLLQDTIRQVWFNTSRQPLSNVYIRRALRDSVQWDTVYDYLQEAGESPATGYIAPAATLADGTMYRQEDNAACFTTQAKQAQAALGKGLQALYPEQDAPVLPRMTVVAARDEVSSNVARYLIQSWQKHLHLRVDLQLMDDTALEAAVTAGNYDIALYTHTATGLTGAENLAAYASDGVGNLSRLKNSSVDKAISVAMRGGREELTALEQQLRNLCPSLPLSFPARYYGVSAGSEGITVRPFSGGQYGCPFAFSEAKKWD